MRLELSRILSSLKPPNYDLISAMASPTNNTFEYTPLSGSREIRLIIVRPGVRDEPLVLSIANASLDQNPAYKALSYVWGPQHPSYVVQCNRATLSVGESLRDALLC